MNLVLLYGPPAVGKLTVAKELAKLTGIKLFDNHSIVDVVNEIFGWENPVRRKLEYEIRARVIEEAARSGVDLIVTGVILKHNHFLYKGFIDSYSMRKGKVALVQLKADRDVLHERVVNESRVKKINKKEFLDDFINKYPDSLEKFGDDEQLVIDTSCTKPADVAKKIAEHYKL